MLHFFYWVLHILAGLGQDILPSWAITAIVGWLWVSKVSSLYLTFALIWPDYVQPPFSRLFGRGERFWTRIKSLFVLLLALLSIYALSLFIIAVMPPHIEAVQHALGITDPLY